MAVARVSMAKALIALSVSVLALPKADAFIATSSRATGYQHQQQQYSSSAAGRHQTAQYIVPKHNEDDIMDLQVETTTSRRKLFQAAIAISTATLLSPSLAFAVDSSIGSSPDHPIVVLGASGKVGTLCCKILEKKGLYVRACTRSGKDLFDSDKISYAPVDVTVLSQVESALKGASGVIFAASASGKSKGGDPAHVDYLGLYNTAKACLSEKVPKLAVVSAGTVSRPDSAGFKATNFFVKYVYGDYIMDYKIAGESVVRDLYQGSSDCAYTILRPGGLNEKPSVGSNMVHVSQGDVYSSEVTREDVALVTVAALLAGKVTDGTTMEINQVEGLSKAMGSLPDLPAELVHAGASTYVGLVTGLLSDSELKKKYPDLINDGFRGSDKIVPLEQLLA